MTLKLVELVSLGLSITTILLSFSVVFLWSRAAREAVKNKRELDAKDWFILGVFFGFVGETFDNLYWLIPWSLSYLGVDYWADVYFAWGVVPNLPFRQVLGAVAAYCHIKAHFKFNDPEDRRHDTVLKLAIFAGICYSGMLMTFIH